MTKPTLGESAKRWWEVNFGFANILLAIAGLLIGIWQFNAGEIDKTKQEYKSLRDKDRIEFRRKLWLERLEAYRTTADSVGRISAHPSRDQKFDNELQSFEAAYWGRMILVEDPKVESAMRDFRDAARDFRDSYRNADQLKRAADQLGVALKSSIDTDSVAIDLKKTETGMQP
jgi:hypothetical protein